MEQNRAANGGHLSDTVQMLRRAIVKEWEATAPEDKGHWEREKEIVNQQVEENMKKDKPSQGLKRRKTSNSYLPTLPTPQSQPAPLATSGGGSASRGLVAECDWIVPVEQGASLKLPPSFFAIVCDLQRQMFARQQASVDSL